jgi:gluconokinase
MIIVLVGVSGSGKTSVGQALSQRMHWVFLDADDYHPESNIAKMSRGEPLNDGDRAPWLEKLQGVIETQIQKGESTILACSALKKSYRVKLSQTRPQSVYFVYLKVSQELLEARLEKREGHFMKSRMLHSQLEDLEEPTVDEAYVVEVQEDISPESLAIAIQSFLNL